jgi:hypothetical protein
MAWVEMRKIVFELASRFDMAIVDRTRPWKSVNLVFWLQDGMGLGFRSARSDPVGISHMQHKSIHEGWRFIPRAFHGERRLSPSQ